MEWRILGSLEVSSGDRLVDLGGPKQRLLLALLLLEANHVIALDRLIDQLWGSRPPARATATLQVFISNLRRALEPERAPRTSGRVLLTRPPGYVLAVDPDDLDARRFERAGEEVGQLLEAGQPALAHRAATVALDMWRGPALAEFADEPFARIEAARLNALRLVTAENRVQADLDRGRHEAAVVELEALVADHPLRERLWEMLMLAQYRAGLQADALRSFQRARSLLGEELGIAPGPALQQLERDILAQAPSVDWRPSPSEERISFARSQAPAGAVGDGGHADQDPGPAVLVGRDEQLGVLRQGLAGAMAGHGGVVLVTGEPGIGKTRLSLELAGDAPQAGAAVAWGRCFEGGGAPPFWPWVQILRAVMPALPEVGDQPRWVVAALSQMLPELRAGDAPSQSTSADPAEARFQLFAAVTDTLIRFTRNKALVIVLDDLHWADPASLQLLELLSSRIGTARLLVVANYRDTEMEGNRGPLPETVGSLLREAGCRRIRLLGLTVGEVADVVANATGKPASATLATNLHARTDGNPFFLTELVRLLHSEGMLAASSTAADLPERVPPTVRDVVRRRLDRLPEQTNALLTIGAVAGPHFEHRVLEAVGGLDEERTLTLMEAAIVTGIVEDRGEVVGRYQFSHPLVRQTIYEGLSGVRRARLHVRVADALERLAGEEAVVDIAHHLWQALGEVDPARAVPTVLRAAEAALAQLAYEEAAEQFQRAVTLLKAVPAGAGPASQELAVQLRLAQLLAMTRSSRTPETEAALARARDLTADVGDAPHLLPALWSLFFTLQLRCEIEPGRELAERFLETAARLDDDRFRVAGHLGLGITSYLRGQLAAAHEHLERALASSRACSSSELMASFQIDPGTFALGADAHVLALQGRRRAAAKLAREAVTGAAKLGNPLATAIACSFSSLCALLADDVAQVELLAEATRKVSVEGGFRGLEAIADACKGWVMVRKGEPREGAALARAGLAQLRATGNVWGMSYIVVICAAVETEREGQAAALALVEHTLSQGEAGGERFFEAELHRLRAELLAARAPAAGATAEASARRAIAVATAQGAMALAERATSTLERLERRAAAKDELTGSTSASER